MSSIKTTRSNGLITSLGQSLSQRAPSNPGYLTQVSYQKNQKQQMLYFILLTQLVELVTSHASMIMPPSRNAIDSNLPAWHNSNISNPPETGTIEPYNCRCTNGTEPFCNAGQACFWFSQGCTIGCSKCDGLGARSVYFF